MNDLEHMRNSVFFHGPDVRHRLSRFWILITLSAIIAAAGVVADSAATVIGAMIVAPLMTPVLGTVLSVVLADRLNLIRSLLLVAGGALAAIAIGWLLGLIVVNDVAAATNSQVAGRVAPRLIDLLAALATGAVGSVALVRSDVSDTLPGVAIAISLVPPLSVAGLTLESGEFGQSLGALLLFLTNVAAILGSGTVVMAIYGVQRLIAPDANSGQRTINRRNAILVIAAMIVIVSVPLTTSSISIARDTSREARALEAAGAFGKEVGWTAVEVTTSEDMLVIQMEGPLPVPDTEPLQAELESRGVDPSGVRAELEPAKVVILQQSS
ncbi:DUF389 domain-containing protein [Rubrobacter aplysinae]|uniref:DUF389 domain-containing protein n=1 Tax=Rubrobacter aplysinae TaxID=909625 RepID=UPI000A66C580|nr:DUF389 domain-containing protein [Rubrobacter aplysinae]